MKLGLFGGMFDPIHRGHLRCAEEAISIFNLQKVLFIPSASPPHKNCPKASPEDRAAMIKLAIQGKPKFELSTVELNRSETTYTINTLKELITKEVSQPYFIIGSDAFAEIVSWKNGCELFALTNFIVFARAGYSEGGLIEKISQKMLKLGYKADFHIGDKSEQWQEIRYSASSYKIYILKSFLDETSSTEIKRLMKNRSDTKEMLPEKVKEFIAVNKVY